MQEVSGIDTRRWNWPLLAILFCCATLNYSDRAAINSLFPLLRRDLGLSDAGLAATGSLFLWSYALVSPLAGFIGDRVPRRRLITASVAAWSVVTLLTAFAANAAQVLICRGLLGVAEALYMPAAVALISEEHARDTRGRAISFHSAGYSLGFVTGATAAGYIGDRYGWRAALAVLGLAGLLLAMVTRGLPAGERQKRPAQGSIAEAAPWLLNPVFLLILLQALITSTGIWILLTWMPLFFFEEFRLPLAEAGFTGTLFAQIGSIVGLALAGFPSDWLARRDRSRRLLLESGWYVLAAPLLTTFLWSRRLAVLNATVLAFFLLRSLGLANEQPFATELLPRHLRATAIGLINTANCLAGGVGIGLAGLLKARFGLAAVFGMASVLFWAAAILLAAAYWVMHRQPRISVDKTFH